MGAHRRLRRADIEAVLRPEPTRDQLKALWLHRAVAGRLVSDPEAVMAKAAHNLRRLRMVHPDGMAARWLDRWEAVLGAGAEAVLEVLTSGTPDSVELRQNSPFAGVLTETERTAVLAAFRQQWANRRAA
ncbi:helix-turn-helix domain-containing protein [Polymorphospora rubra]|uniref:helix-turn-helix domain-containing protein n=1 Tax=Polymorphospora rubra TaxID=338584 RepID=UPI003F4D571F